MPELEQPLTGPIKINISLRSTNPGQLPEVYQRLRDEEGEFKAYLLADVHMNALMESRNRVGRICTVSVPVKKDDVLIRVLLCALHVDSVSADGQGSSGAGLIHLAAKRLEDTTHEFHLDITFVLEKEAVGRAVESNFGLKDITVTLDEQGMAIVSTT